MSTPIPASATRITRLHIVLAALFIFIATVMTFVNAVRADFVNWDDDFYVTNNPLVAEVSRENVVRILIQPHYYAWIPVTLLSHMADVAFWGMNPRWHHLTNVVVHAANTVLLFIVGLLVLRAARERISGTQGLLPRITSSMFFGSVVCAVLFAMHPLRVESVAWVSGRKDLLCAFFLLLSFGAYIIWHRRAHTGTLIFSVVAFALALMSKPMAILFPIVLLLADLWLLSEKGTTSVRLADKVPFFAVSLVAGFIALISVSGGRVNPLSELTLIERVLLPFYMPLFYFVKTVLPVNLSPIYPELHPLLVYSALPALLLVVYAGYILTKRHATSLLLAVSAYVLILLPTFLGIASGLQPLADRYSYLATLSIFLFVGGTVETAWRTSSRSGGKRYQRRLLMFVLLALCAVSSYRTIRHVAVWNNSVTLWTQALRNAPHTTEEYEARKPYMKPTYADAAINLGVAYYEANEPDKAAGMFTHALLLEPCLADAHYNLGNVLYEEGDTEASLNRFKKAVACDPEYAKAYFNMGVLYAKMQNNEAALESLQKAARLGFPDAQEMLMQQGLSW